jgi:energy-coupling factor transporter ATP-binding protein EcfA2
MANSAIAMFDLTLQQTTDLIKAVGNQRTVLAQGHMGVGKSSILKMLAKTMPNHAACYFDCTTKDVGDITIPRLQTMDEQGYVSYVPNEELGLHLNKPVIIMVDEYGKANRSVQNAMLRLMLERKLGGYTLHPESIVFATTNLGAEGVGDILLPHARNRLIVVRVKKPDNLEWMEWAVNNDIDPTLIAYAKDNPQIFYSFEDVKDPADNEHIFHPKAQRAAFTTPRSLHCSSDILKQRHLLDDITLTAALMGAVGERTAMDLMAYVKVSDQLPSPDSIKKDPLNAKVPESATATAMVVYRALATIERNWVDSWVTYMRRLDRVAQGLFANGVRRDNYEKRDFVMQNSSFGAWALENNDLFVADKK